MPGIDVSNASYASHLETGVIIINYILFIAFGQHLQCIAGKSTTRNERKPEIQANQHLFDGCFKRRCVANGPLNRRKTSDKY